MPLNDLEGHFCCLQPLQLPYLMTHSMNLLIWHVAQSLCGSGASCFNHIVGIGEARNFKYRVLIDTEEY